MDAMIPCNCPRPTQRLEDAIDHLNQMPPFAGGEQLKERYRSLIGIAVVDRDSKCPLCLGEIKAGF